MSVLQKKIFKTKISSHFFNQKKYFSSNFAKGKFAGEVGHFRGHLENGLFVHKLIIPGINNFHEFLDIGNIIAARSCLNEWKMIIEEKADDKQLDPEDLHYFSTSAIIKEIEIFEDKLLQSAKQEIILIQEQHQNKSKDYLKGQFKAFRPGQHQQLEKIAISGLLNNVPVLGNLNPNSVLFGDCFFKHAERHSYCTALLYAKGITPDSLIKRADIAIPVTIEGYNEITQFPLVAKQLAVSLNFVPKGNNKFPVYWDPGWGLWSEETITPVELEKNGHGWIGPNAEVMQKLDNKIEAKKLALQAGVPTLPFTEVDVNDPDWSQHEFFKNPKSYPVMLKDPNGGGGRYIYEAGNLEEISKYINLYKTLGINKVLVEKFLNDPRHIEVQVLDDETIDERECSNQINNHKLNEQAIKDPKAREYARKFVKHIGYKSAGTVEFLKVSDDYYFMEFNKRLQVEHPVTVKTMGIDLMQARTLLATNALTTNITASDKKYNYAMQARIYFEKLSQDDNGKVHQEYIEGKVLRGLSHDDFKEFDFANDIDIFCGVEKGDDFKNTHLNPHFASIVIGAYDREQGLARMAQCLKKMKSLDFGLSTNVELQEIIVQSQPFQTDTQNICTVPKVILPNYLQQKSLENSSESSMTLR